MNKIIKNTVAFEKDYLNGKPPVFFSITDSDSIIKINKVIPLQIWTLLQNKNGENSRLTSGFRQSSDVIGYILTTLPFQDNEEIIIDNNFKVI